MNPIQVSRDGQTIGEFVPQQIQEGLGSGYFQATDWYWGEGMTEWRQLTDFVQQAQPSPAPTAPLTAPVRATPSTPRPQPAQLQPGMPRPRAVAAPSKKLHFDLATPWQRLMAVLGDILAPCVLFLGLAYIVDVTGLAKEGMMFLYIMGGGLLMWLLLNLGMVAACGQTVGKKLTGIRVVDVGDGSTSGLVTIIVMRNIVGRLLPSIIPIYPLVDACFVFSEQRRCLHDRIAGTMVVKV